MSEFNKYHCLECEHIYDEEKGDPDSGIAPGTCWADIPDDWACPICGAPKSFFKLMSQNWQANAQFTLCSQTAKECCYKCDLWST